MTGKYKHQILVIMYDDMIFSIALPCFNFKHKNTTTRPHLHVNKTVKRLYLKTDIFLNSF